MTALHDLLKDARNYLESIGYTQKPKESETTKVPKVSKKSETFPNADSVAHGMQIWFDKKIAVKKKKAEIEVSGKETENIPAMLDVDISPKADEATMSSVIGHIDAVSTGSIVSSWQPDDLLIEFPLNEQAKTIAPDPVINVVEIEVESKNDFTEPSVSTAQNIAEPSVEENEKIEKEQENAITFEVPLDQMTIEQTPEEIVLEAKERWLKEKRSLHLAKKQENKNLKEFYDHKYTEFRKNIGTSW